MKELEFSMIPKEIHYIWLGGKPKSKLTEVCINSWRRNLKDYEINEWNENNLDLQDLCKRSTFLKKCYELKLWAFVSDYLRLYILYHKGGIYLDTDVEVLKSYDTCLDNEMFIGYENNGYLGTAVIGSTCGNRTVKRLLEFYDNEIWKVDFFNNPIIFKYLLEKEPGSFSGCKIYPQKYFSPYNQGVEYNALVEEGETISIHWYSANWNMSKKGYVFLNTKHISNPVLKMLISLKKNLGYYKRKQNV